MQSCCVRTVPHLFVKFGLVGDLCWFDGNVQATSLLHQAGRLGPVAQRRLDVPVVVHHGVDVVQRGAKGETLGNTTIKHQ
jgi:hypothetical protein